MHRIYDREMAEVAVRERVREARAARKGRTAGDGPTGDRRTFKWWMAALFQTAR